MHGPKNKIDMDTPHNNHTRFKRHADL